MPARETERSIAIGLRLRQCREARGWSQRELGRRCVPSQVASGISHMEVGRYGFSDTRLATLAQALGEPVEALTQDYCPSCGHGLSREGKLMLLRQAIAEVTR